jgi:hypothetical protein
MSPSKQPNDPLPEQDNSPVNDSEEAETQSSKFSLADMKAAIKKGNQPALRHDPKARCRGPKIGNAPRGTRRSMGKR